MALALLHDDDAYPVGTTVALPVDLLEADNYRTDSDPGAIRRLADAIAAEGRVHSPVRVWRRGARFVLLAGHHRTAAVRLLGWPTIPATIEEEPGDAGAHLLAAVADNESHREAALLETADAFGRLVDAGYSVDQIATACARTAGYVERRLSLLALDPTVRPVVAGRGLTYAAELADLPHNLQRECARHLSDETTAGAWRGICARARELAAERAQGSMFDGGAFELRAETWSTELGRYVEEMGAADEVPPAPVVVREAPLGVSEVAERLGVTPATVAQWRRRDWTRFPAPDLTIAAGPLWWASTIDDWAAATGRGK